ncbi:hypothetical protein PPO22_18115 [Proteus mirabilis]|uniref:Uncharacterized protein n=1 Tax=Proteus genomosp. 6 TaxID=1311820 RepID=A0ABV1LDS3_9GAMM|nr:MULTISPECIES: hypothetical protein [Morganellaceae]EJD6602409.1 hypothetical protein [Providencia rettgeri]MBQ0214616.1 hypothetical protein [Proteus vulgaris]MCX2589696.1 hypothetical protein [Proteus penneri]MDC5889454.1 hypothetical protein [Proteus mirabilis]MDC5907051.1 hypothetical protein [Proteus mirabilis]
MEISLTDLAISRHGSIANVRGNILYVFIITTLRLFSSGVQYSTSYVLL